MRYRLAVSSSLLSVVLVAATARAATPEAPADPLAMRAEAVLKLFVADPTVPEGLFAPGFLAAVPVPKIVGISKELVAEAGPMTELRLTTRTGPNAGKYEGVFAKGVVAPVSLGIEATPPHRITTLWIGNFSKPVEVASLADLPAKFAELPGEASFAACRLGDGAPQLVAAREPDRALAIGSSFKLWILGTLARDAAEGRHRWDEVVKLSARDRSLPSGFLQDWPEGSPVTLHTLASLMISRSDNTATDTLLRALGRERVEETMSRMGAAAAGRNRPFLSTAEMFALKGVLPKERSAAFAGMDESARRKFLAGELAAVDLKGFQDWSEPYENGRIEWFASAADLCRGLDWLRKAGEKKGGEPVLGVLAINEGLPQAGRFAYHGFKGGSEPGVVAHAHLVRTKDGAWWALAAVWNDAKPLQHGQLHALLERGFALIAEEKPAAAAAK